MKVDEMHARMRTILLEAAQKHIALKVVGMAWQCWMTKEIFDKYIEREGVHQSEGIHMEAYKNLSKEVSRLTTEVK